MACIKTLPTRFVDSHWFQQSGNLGQCGPDPGFSLPKILKFYSWKNPFYLIKNCNLLSRLHEGRPNYRRKLLPLKTETRNFWRFFYFCGSFLSSWIRTRIPTADPDPAFQNQCGSGSSLPKSMRIRIHNSGSYRDILLHNTGTWGVRVSGLGARSGVPTPPWRHTARTTPHAATLAHLGPAPAKEHLKLVGRINFFVYFFSGLECVGHSFAYVAHFVFLRDVWIRILRELPWQAGALST